MRQEMISQDLARATGAFVNRAAKWLPAIESAMQEFDINTPARQAAFLAQIGHESGGLYWTAEIWGPTKAQLRYEGRADLGNIESGDGLKFKGRGLIQITGRANYKAVGEALNVDLLTHPEFLEERDLAARSAAWFWKQHGLNELADAGEFKRITQIINGGLNGYDQRLVLYQNAIRVLA